MINASIARLYMTYFSLQQTLSDYACNTLLRRKVIRCVYFHTII